jgi:hypothetical protein
MKSHRTYLLSALALAILAPLAHAEKEMQLRRIEGDQVYRAMPAGDLEKEQVTFLGVETAPVSRTLSAQLGLAKDTGLVVTRVMETSPAAEVLKEDDVLTKLEDQLVVNMPQLGVLVRSRKEGEQIKLTIIRAGKEMTVKARLAVHEIPKQANAWFFKNDVPHYGFERLRELPGMGPDDARDVLRMIERERGNVMTGPGVHILNREGRGSTIVDLPRSNISYADDEGSIEIKVDDGKRNLTVKNPKGEVSFSGPINTEDERKKLPSDVSQRLEKLETDTMSFEVNDDFQPEVVPLPPETKKTRIDRKLGHDPSQRMDRASPSF